MACDEAKKLNAIGDRRVDPLEPDELSRRLHDVYEFKLGLKNSFGIDFRKHSRPSEEADCKGSVLFNYLSEVLPFAEPQARRLSKHRRQAYERLADQAVSSFWEIYYRFQPLIHRAADEYELDVDDLGNVLGRAILLYDDDRGVRFFTYFKKTLRESVKNLRGRKLADQLHLPLSAGRLLPKIWWLIDKASMQSLRQLTKEETEHLVIQFLQQHPARFGDETIARIAAVAVNGLSTIALDQVPEGMVRLDPVKSGLDEFSRSDSSIERIEARDQLRLKIQNALSRGQFDAKETAILLERLGLPHDANLFEQAAGSISVGGLRNRRAQLMVRLIAAVHSDAAIRFGRFLHADPLASKPILHRALTDLTCEWHVGFDWMITQFLNEMTLSTQPYRLTITERGRLESFLLAHPMKKSSSITGHLFNKFKACLMKQETSGFPCIQRCIAD